MDQVQQFSLFHNLTISDTGFMNVIVEIEMSNQVIQIEVYSENQKLKLFS